MKKYAKIINEETKQVEVGLGTNAEFYRSIGMSEMDVEQGWDGSWYLKGYAPEKPIEQKAAEVRSVRNQYLEQTDKYLSVSDFPIDEDTKEQYRLYRQYLRDYPETEDWYEQDPLPFSGWNELPGISGELEQSIDGGD